VPRRPSHHSLSVAGRRESSVKLFGVKRQKRKQATMTATAEEGISLTQQHATHVPGLSYSHLAATTNELVVSTRHSFTGRMCAAPRRATRKSSRLSLFDDPAAKALVGREGSWILLPRTDGFGVVQKYHENFLSTTRLVGCWSIMRAFRRFAKTSIISLH